jgi:hypothetical protein
MTIINGHYDGRKVLLDEPVPAGIAAPTAVKVVFEDNGAGGVLDDLVELAERLPIANDPTDWSEQHDHYIHGSPKQ